MSYIIGVSSGWWGVARSDELLGLSSKIGSTATYGVNFVQVDFESIAEFQEPDVIKEIGKLLTTLQIDWGMHGEIGENLALESALEVVWKRSHRRLHQYLDTIYYRFFVEDKEGKLRNYLPKYIAFHASNLPTISMVVERYRYAGHITVDFNGNVNWLLFFEDEDPELREAKKRAKKWFFESELVYLLIARESGVAFMSLEEVKRRVLERAIEKKRIELGKTGSLTQEEVEQIIRSLTPEDIENTAWEYFEEISSLRFARGAITYEEISYLLVARYLFEARDSRKEPLWRAFFKDKNWEDIQKETKIDFFDKEKMEIRLPDDIVALVASRYIIGHLWGKNKEEFIVETRKTYGTNDQNFIKFLEKTPIEKLHELGIRIVFENPEIARAGEEGLHRLCRASDIFRLVKTIDNLYREAYGEKAKPYPLIGMVFDQEHYLHNNMDPLKEIEGLKEVMEDLKEKDAGRFIYVFHVSAPKPYHPAHEPIDIGSEAQYWIYKYAYELRKLGFGKGSNVGIIVFERGGARGGQMPIQFVGQSAAALRIVVEYLEKEVDPEKLPMEFYGVDSKEILSFERQLNIVREHHFDPLRGLLRVPEERFTFLGKKVIEKGKSPEEWRREELR